jgi:pimeloyl-ACP methyl ester carboxylesterase
MATGATLSLPDLEQRGSGAPQRPYRGALKGGLAVVLMAVIGMIVAVLVLQARTAREQAIGSPAGVDLADFVTVEGVPQWVTIRGENRRNPLLLVIPDAPGRSQSGLVDRYRLWERDFTVVQWDPPGSGRTLARAAFRAPAASAALWSRDAARVLAYAQRRTGQASVVVLSSGWGANVALRLSRERTLAMVAAIAPLTAPRAERERAFYAQMLEFARGANDDVALDDLEQAGAPPWTTPARVAIARRLVAGELADGSPRWDAILYELVTSPHWTPLDVAAYYRGLRTPPAADDAADFAPLAGAPVLFIQPTHDRGEPVALGLAWFNRLQAPRRSYWRVPERGHAIALTDGERLHGWVAGELQGRQLQLSP